MTDCEKALQILKERRSLGVHSFELNTLLGTTRSAARIQDLKDMGHSISSVPEKRGDSLGVRYYLVAEMQNPTQKNGRWDFSTGNARWIQS